MYKPYYAALACSAFVAALTLSFALPWFQVVLFMVAAAPVGYYVYKAIESINLFFNHIDHAVRDLNDAIRDVDTTVNNLNTHLNRTTRQLDRLLQHTDEAIPDIREAIRDTNRTVRTINNTVNQLTPQLVRTIGGTGRVVDQLNGAAEAIGTFGTVVTAPAAALRRLGRRIVSTNQPAAPQLAAPPRIRRSRGGIR